MWRWLWRKKWKITGAYLALLAGVLPLLSHYVVTAKLLPPVRESLGRVEPHYPALLADLEKMDADPVFPDAIVREKNAEGFLSDRLPWEGLESSPAVKAAVQQLQAIDAAFPGWRTDGGALKKLYESPQLSAAATEWVGDLLDYDHWDISSRREYLNRLQQAGQRNGLERIAIFAKLPLPNYIDYRNAVFLHFLKMQKSGRGHEGLKIIRHAARLAHTSGTLVGAMIAANMLEAEAAFARAFGQKSWQAVSQEQVERYRRLSWSWPVLARVSWLKEFPPHFTPYLKAQNGVCTGAWESAVGVNGLQEFLEPRFWFETDFSEDLARARAFEVRIHTICHMNAYAPLRGRTPASANTWMIDGNIADRMINPARVPYLRRWFALTLLGYSAPSSMRYYEKPQN